MAKTIYALHFYDQYFKYSISTVLSTKVLQELTANYSIIPEYSKQSLPKMVFAALWKQVHMRKLLRVTSD